MQPEAARRSESPEAQFARWRETCDPAALGALFDEAAPGLFRLALSLTPDAAAAEDALQETFLFAMEEAERHDPARPVVPWLAGILRLKVLEERRRNARAPRPDRVTPPVPPEDPELAAMDAEERERLHEAMRRLPEPYRGVALLRWRYGLEPAAIAEVRGVPPGTVWSWLHRAVARLKASMVALPALLLAFRGTRGLDGIREALLRRAASEAAASAGASAAAGTGAALVTGGIVMASKIAFVGAGAVVFAVAAWMLWPGGEAAPAGTAPPPPPPAPPPGKVESPQDPVRKGDRFDPAVATATIKVRATVKGTLPPRRSIKFDADAHCAQAHAGAPVLEQFIVEKDGRLANVIAYVSKGAEKWTFEAPSEPVLLDQKGCMYEPHVFTVQVNQPIAVRNSDPTMHNIHSVPKKNDEWNKSQSKGAADFQERFTKEELGIRIKCDVHGWMQSWAGVFSHPFHGVTTEQGTAFLRVPPGEFEVSAWHESEGKIGKPAPQKVTVAAGETKEVEFVYVYDVR